MQGSPVTVLLLNGPNLGRLGEREPELYGERTLEEIVTGLRELCGERGMHLEHFQSEREGELVERMQRAVGEVEALIINPGGLAHTSVVLHDAIRALGPIPKVEVHLSNPSAREEFRQRQITAAACDAVISGLGPESYRLALDAVSHLLTAEAEESPGGPGRTQGA